MHVMHRLHTFAFNYRSPLLRIFKEDGLDGNLLRDQVLHMVMGSGGWEGLRAKFQRPSWMKTSDSFK